MNHDGKEPTVPTDAKPKFDAAFIERRMREHKAWQHECEYAMLEEIIDEVQALPKRKPKAGRLFLELPEHMRDSAAVQ